MSTAKAKGTRRRPTAGATDKVKLHSAEGVEFVVERRLLTPSGLIRGLLTDLVRDVQTPVTLPNVSGPILERILIYLSHHREEFSRIRDRSRMRDMNADLEIPLSAWDAEYCKMDQGTLVAMILAANYMEILPLLNLLTRAAAGLLMDKTPEEMRRDFDIKNDFTPEEERQVNEENRWVEESG